MGGLNRTAIREGRHFPHAAAKRTSFDALAKDYAETVLAEFDEVQRAARTLQLNWWCYRHLEVRRVLAV